MKRRELVLVAIMMIAMWMGVTMMWQAFACPKMTQTELFLASPQHMLGEFKHCK